MWFFKVKYDCRWKTSDKFRTDQLLLQLFLWFSISSKWNFFCFIFFSLFLCLCLAACSLPDSFISSWFPLQFVQVFWFSFGGHWRNSPSHDLCRAKEFAACELFVAGSLWLVFWKECVNRYCIEEQHWSTGVHLSVRFIWS